MRLVAAYYALLVVALAACPSASSAPAPAPAPSADARTIDAAPLECFNNLCGMDNYCSCHDASADRRCWTQANDCGVDLTCCVADAPGCRQQGADRCSKKTAAARAARDRKSP